jgi:hypothetical protein
VNIVDVLFYIGMSIYEDRTLKCVEIILNRGEEMKENNGWGGMNLNKVKVS